jgi:hypothetical protein
MPNILSGRARHVMIAHRNFADAAGVTSPTSFAPSLPLDNMLSEPPDHVARASGGGLVLDVDFGQPVPVTLIMVLCHNLTAMARWRIRAADTRTGAAGDPGGYGFPLAATRFDSRPTLRSGTAHGLLAWAGGVEVTSPITLAAGPCAVRVTDTDMRLYPGAVVRLRLDAGRYMEGVVTGYAPPSRTLSLAVSTVIGAGSAPSMVLERAAADPSVWPAVESFGNGYWGNFTWGGQLSDVGADYQPPGVYMPAINAGLADPVYGRYVKIEISDPARDHIDIGRLVISPAYQPSVNAQYGWELQYIDPSQRTRTRGGRVIVDKRRPYRRLTISLEHIPQDEMLTEKYELDRILGVSKPMTVIVFPAQPMHLHRLTVYGTQPETTPISNSSYRRYKTSITVEE